MKLNQVEWFRVQRSGLKNQTAYMKHLDRINRINRINRIFFAQSGYILSIQPAGAKLFSEVWVVLSEK